MPMGFDMTIGGNPDVYGHVHLWHSTWAALWAHVNNGGRGVSLPSQGKYVEQRMLKRRHS